MLHREILSPEEVLGKMPNLSEGLFAIRCQLTNKTYQIILYKYQEDYFLVENPALISVLLEKDRSFFGTSEQLLNAIEMSFEDNHYQPTTKEWVNLDLNTLSLLDNVEIKFFDLEE
ncbi:MULTISPECIES: hypothetical protein [Enterococcus]|uniref:Uncharacterized protein n=1 Tax=Enterococcus malodoratus ATCC 43197 TaxID=1158601 RepID=R2S0J1_9ENTE|nr:MULTISPECIES: hypothetical protein [Enterococcus]BBM18193.1 hypothetical protein G15_1857 [Enterococcus avium]EOH81704.1 hypothetical protein UAI_00312 [Enterococcus malodoratus ATCC 43197]EOT68786.1 hypothetical protein I585_00244 [Enterococcus malodoratus ATCC 43197]OJG64855.1 hypothetical protein RV07_GL003808 [Enterococcus malodoratus]SET87317.1 hypothetical protein SAMN04487821_12653 [Enterococcus malodoratus]